uniref:Uncharacterized protein n=1 Tax=Romanomermis culicivorax TaxID=13658 RepID=A0A915J7K8_ROMCU
MSSILAFLLCMLIIAARYSQVGGSESGGTKIRPKYLNRLMWLFPPKELTLDYGRHANKKRMDWMDGGYENR